MHCIRKLRKSQKHSENFGKEFQIFEIFEISLFHIFENFALQWQTCFHRMEMPTHSVNNTKMGRLVFRARDFQWKNYVKLNC